MYCFNYTIFGKKCRYPCPKIFYNSNVSSEGYRPPNTRNCKPKRSVDMINDRVEFIISAKCALNANYFNSVMRTSLCQHFRSFKLNF